MLNMLYYTVKVAGIISCVMLCNYFVLQFGVNATFLMHAWGIACWLVFMDALQLQHDFQLVSERLKHVSEKYSWLQEIYHREIHMTEIKHIEFIKTLNQQRLLFREELLSLNGEIHQPSCSSESDFDVQLAKRALHGSSSCKF